VAYPISPRLSKPLQRTKVSERYKQIAAHIKSPIHVALPISGAAVGTQFFTSLIENLHQQAAQFIFHVVAKSAPYTKTFLTEMAGRRYVRLYVSDHDREIVEMYEDIYHKNVIAFEVTKPSEQAFKCLLTPKLYGGAILLFSTPVGRQEYDNLYFLRRHNLLPTESENEQLVQLATAGKPLTHKLAEEAVYWRGVRIPDNADLATTTMMWALKESLFVRMMRWQPTPRNDNKHAHELTSNGVSLFWKTVAEFVRDTLNTS
jgi:hypothetical protein